MNLHQLRFVRETVRQHFSLTEAAKALFTSQPGVSKAILELEDELGFAIFKRHGKRLKGLTREGEAVYAACEKALAEVENIKRMGLEFAASEHGQLVLAVTHTQARYVLPRAVAAFRERYPKVKLILLQGTPEQLVQWVLRDQADLAIATEALDENEALLTLPCYEWGHVVVAPKNGPWLAGHVVGRNGGNILEVLNLHDLAQVPIVTYEQHFAGRRRLDAAFTKAGVVPDVVLEAIDADVIKTYVALGLGVGLIAEVAFDASRDVDLVALPVNHLFGHNITRVAFRKGVFMRSVMREFMQVLAPGITAKLIDSVIQGGHSYEL